MSEKFIPVPAQTIDEVITTLEQLINDCIKRKDRIGYFAALYYKVTVRVKKGILNNEFEDGARMERLDVIFANRYLAAVQAYYSGKTPTQSWLTAFTYTRKRVPLVLQHLLSGINAHINLDLGIAAVETMRNQDIQHIQKDFNQINNLIGSLVFEVMTDLNRVSPLLSLFGFHATNNSILIQFSINNARDGAWSFAEDLYIKINQPAYAECINKRDNTIAQLGTALLKPKGLLRFTRWVIHLFEWRNAAKIIRVFFKAEKVYITVNTDVRSRKPEVGSKELIS